MAKLGTDIERTETPASEASESVTVPVSLAIKTVLVLAVFFFIVSLAQMSYLHWTLKNVVASGVPDFATRIMDSSAPGDTSQNQLAVAALLESEAIVRRHENAQVTQMGHLWIRYLGSVTGMIMAVIGSVFILARIQTPERSNISGEFQNFKLAIASASPGLILAVLGCIMMTISVLSQHESTVTDGALYAPFASGNNATVAFRPPELPQK